MRLPVLKKSCGFTLVELMVVMTVIAILATMVLFGLSATQAAARDAGRQQIMTGVQGALERYYGDFQAYPSGTFCNLFANATPTGMSGYLSEPLDPSDKKGVCTGGGNCAGGSCTIGGVADKVKYVYTPLNGNQKYNLNLTKEAGGVSPFTNPQ